MDFTEKTIDSKRIYDGKILSLRVDTVELPDKTRSKRELVEHSGGVAVVAITAEKELLLVRQYRKAMEKELLELPAGKLDQGEPALDCALRELREETGYEAQSMELVASFYTAPGFCNEKVYIYQAGGLQYRGMDLDEGEFLELERVSIDSIDQIIGKVEDAKTLIALYYLKSKLGEGFYETDRDGDSI